MPFLFKIFLFFLLKQGVGVLNNEDAIISIQSMTMPISNQTSLNLQGDPQALEEAIMICQEYLPEEVQRDFNESLPMSSKVSIRFLSIADENRSRISRQLILRMSGRLLMDWKVEM